MGNLNPGTDVLAMHRRGEGMIKKKIQTRTIKHGIEYR
jgi:hypothetical protein